MSSWALVAAVVCANVVGDTLQAWGVRRGGFPGGAAIALSIGAMAASFFSLLRLLAVADLSFAIPATASYMVLDTVSARTILHERVDARRWLAVGLVACGVAMLAL
jgi:drug/metabolite transporter (DMT)-like permease